MNHIRGGAGPHGGGVVGPTQYDSTYRAFSFGSPADAIGIRFTLSEAPHERSRVFSRFVMPRHISEPKADHSLVEGPQRRRLRVAQERAHANVRRRPPKRLR